VKVAEDLTLAEAVDQIYYGASCENCKETRQVDLQKLIDRFGPAFKVRGIVKRLRCKKCSGKNVRSVTLWKESTMNARLMAHWKDRLPDEPEDRHP
jgi:hypothetical protein